MIVYADKAAAADGADEREAGNKGDGGAKDEDEYDEDTKVCYNYYFKKFAMAKVKYIRTW